MAYRVRDLLDTPHLRLTLKGGRDGLDTPVTWAQTSDLEEPWSYLAGGELLMKNGQTLPESARGQTAPAHEACTSALALVWPPFNVPLQAFIILTAFWA